MVILPTSAVRCGPAIPAGLTALQKVTGHGSRCPEEGRLEASTHVSQSCLIVAGRARDWRVDVRETGTSVRRSGWTVMRCSSKVSHRLCLTERWLADRGLAVVPWRGLGFKSTVPLPGGASATCGENVRLFVQPIIRIIDFRIVS